MSVLILPSKWTSNKPPLGSQIDFSHPLSSGLVGCWLMNEGGGIKVNNLASNIPGSLVNGIVWKTGIKGTELLGSSGYVNVPSSNSLNLVGDMTIVTVVKVTSVVSANIFIGKRVSANNQWQFWTGGGSSQKLFFYNGTTAINTTNNVISLNVYQQDVVVRKGTSISWYLNGRFIQTVSLALPTSGTGAVYIGFDNGASYLVGSMLYMYIYSRALLPQEIQQLYIEPYCFIQPIRRKIYFVPTGETPTTTGLTLGWISCNTKFWGN